MGCSTSVQPASPTRQPREVVEQPGWVVKQPPERAVKCVPEFSIVQQPHVLVEQTLPTLASTLVEVRRNVCEIPFNIDIRLAKASMLTEAEIFWNQSSKLPLRFEAFVDCRSLATPCSLIHDGETRRVGGTFLRSRLQLNEPMDNVRALVLSVLPRSAALGSDAEWIHIQEVLPRGLPRGSAAPCRRLLRPPLYWAPSEAGAPRRVDVVAAEHLAVFQRLLDDTWKGCATRDRRGPQPRGLFVRKVQRIEAPGLWNRFSRYRRQLALRRQGACTPVAQLGGNTPPVAVRTQAVCDSAPDLFGPCEPNICEHYLFHGTSPAGAMGIIREGFDIGRARSGASLLFGPGAYFAEASSKFDEYTEADEFSGMRAVLVCRVLCGEMFRALRKLDPTVTSDPCFMEGYDGVLGDREASVGTYREFVVFGEEQIYPEYVLFYDRQC